MIRSETDSSWILVTHPDHARIAGEFADAWGNERFARPEPYAAIRHAVYHHDDGWLARDAAPSLTRAGKPEAFTSALVGAYSAFEEIDLPAYLGVRARATAEVAVQDAYAGIVVSMHTYNLLTEQADASTIRPEHRAAYETFLAEQLAWQRAVAQRLGADEAELRRAFEFLQCCDSLSLIVCSGYAQPRDLRHTHADRSGARHAVRCTPRGAGVYALDPWPLCVASFPLNVRRRVIDKAAAQSLEDFRTAFGAAPVEIDEIMLVPA